MPELPEVELVARYLRGALHGRRITAVRIEDPRLTRPVDPRLVERQLTGRRIEKVSRRGKWIVITLDGPVLLSHLRMTGVYVHPARPSAHRRAVIDLDHGAELKWASTLAGATPTGHGVSVSYEDVRRFGWWGVMEDAAAAAQFLDARLGPEPLGADWNRRYLGAALIGRRGTIKGLLLDQAFVAGVGNIYADEALYRARIHPRTRGEDLSHGQTKRLAAAVSAVLQAGVIAGGASISDYRRPDGSEGSMQNQLDVYGRGGQPCLICGAALEQDRIAGRVSVWCPTCQPEPDS
ncbi:bifunctional DNA-formamidopyrimidine glycosylase/DNA-(apurinic or apyrimidinic site) lyase [Miltoncostaea oceani]|uniref:bifunctional DNA-formamidopyrimidine glycosylase/DNA-(apurinic or apyrimidinic site) lyase n=1 Tax=Miltoncostaea oceani TaxID=2843216 RepID=UPI001C3CF913|nr:bifunctional DNA-formamidopyrimidine glycosylase/DNA-(apurinic or apyrimidinic site) lyase [Miltoncostaea oceani]